MNIFRILSSNDGSINEPNVSSFLAYLLNPSEDHGISSFLLQELLNSFLKISKNYFEKIQYNGRITDLSNYSGFSINILPELLVNYDNANKKKRRDIDIVLEIIDNKKNEIIYAICIENKISDYSINKNDSQLEDELKGLINFYSENKLNPEIYVIYLTPSPSKISQLTFKKLDYEKKSHIYWDNDNDNNSLFNMLSKIFTGENQGLIDPINGQSSYLIKSFMSFIKTNFKSYVEERQEKLEKRNYGKPVIDHLNDFAQTLDINTIYKIEFLKQEFSKYVSKNSGIELHITTRNAHISLSIVNEKNRGHYGVKKPDDDRKNIFYYTDETKKNVKRFQAGESMNVNIYFHNGKEIDCVNPSKMNRTDFTN